jgi:hypothetical protein
VAFSHDISKAAQAANTKLSVAQVERLCNPRKIYTFIEPIKVRV